MRVFIDKARLSRIKGNKDNLDKLCKDLQTEESRCNGCHFQYNVSVIPCSNCKIYKNIKEHEKSIRDMLEVMT
ncbi:MAG: hypothetical protein NC118_14625 [Eubacterium sp.]|nr:hypothetical protein [Eubacterium sp.]